tara:strand:- start:72 stop:752 length:681 start_codon:yes stop_codon:yes gene_type:complete
MHGTNTHSSSTVGVQKYRNDYEPDHVSVLWETGHCHTRSNIIFCEEEEKKSDQCMEGKVDEVAQQIGELYIWYRIFTAAVIFLVFSIISIGVGGFVRRGWTSDERKIVSVHCETTTEEDCDTTNHTTTCKEVKKKRCDIKLEGSHREFNRTYAPGAYLPKNGETMRVYYKPLQQEETITITWFPKTLITTLTAAVAIGNLIWIVFLLNVKDSAMAKRVGALSAVAT